MSFFEPLGPLRPREQPGAPHLISASFLAGTKVPRKWSPILAALGMREPIRLKNVFQTIQGHRLIGQGTREKKMKAWGG